MTDGPTLAGLQPCEPCQGIGRVSVPSFTYPTGFGMAHTEPKIVTCPLCNGTGCV